MDGWVNESGIYENIAKKRWEYWYVNQQGGIKTMVSWLCWNAPQSVYDEWSKKVSH